MFQSGTEKYLEASLRRYASWFRASGASIFLYDEFEKSYVIKAKTGHQNRIPDSACIVPGRGLAGAALAQGEAKLIQDRLSDAMSEIVSSMIVPLSEPRHGVIGVLNLSRGDDEPAFTELDLEQVKAMAAQLAMAVTNAKLVERLNEAVRLSQESRERLAAVLDSVPGGVIVLDAASNIISTSPWATEEGLLVMGEGSILESAIQRVSRETISKGRPVSETVTDRGYDRTFMLQTQPMSTGGAVISVQEITQHERAQREVHRLSRLAEIGRMTAAIAHEIRNPLTGISSAAQLIQSSPDLAQDFGKVIEEEAMKLNSLCSEFLEFAKPLRVVCEAALLSGPIRRVADLVGKDFEKKGVELKLEIPALEPTIYMDVRRIEQVLHNLIRNSGEACKPGGKTTVRAFRWGFEVEDNGSGIDEAAQAQLFLPFFTTKANGTGLGLSTAMKIVEAHGGSITVDSATGRGTLFRVRLNEE